MKTENRSWVLSVAKVVIPIMLMALALWLWPKMRQVYRLPDSAVITYQKALHYLVPPGTGRITRTAVIERTLAAELGQLSDVTARPAITGGSAWRGVLRFNAQMGRWAAAVMAMPRSRRLVVFNWAMRPANLPIVNLAFSRLTADRILAVQDLAKLYAPPANTLLAILLRDPASIVHLSVMAVLWNRQPTAAEIRILQNWAADPHPYGFATHRKGKIFLFGRQAVSDQCVHYRRDRQVNLTYARHFASALLTHWKASTVADAARQPRSTPASLTLTTDSPFSTSQTAQTALRADRAALSQAIAAWADHRASADAVKTALAKEYRTLVAMIAMMPWQHQLAKILRFNAAMAHWIYIIDRLPPRTGRTMLNWARFRAQDIQLMYLVMSPSRSQRLRVAAIAPKLHGVQRAWLIHRLLMDPRVSVELTMLHELWKIPATTRLKRVVKQWVHVDPLPKNYTGTASYRLVFHSRRYVIKSTICVQRYQQVRRLGAMLLNRWQKAGALSNR